MHRRANLQLVHGWVPVQPDGLAALYTLTRRRIVNVEHLLSDGAVDAANRSGNAPGVKALGPPVVNERALGWRGAGESLELGDVSAVPFFQSERGTVPGGNVSGVRNRRHLTRLSEWKWIRQAKAVCTLVFPTRF